MVVMNADEFIFVISPVCLSDGNCPAKTASIVPDYVIANFKFAAVGVYQNTSGLLPPGSGIMS